MSGDEAGELTAALISRVSTGYPLPIADAMAALGAAESLHERRDRVVECFRAVLRYLAALALAARAQYGPGPGEEPAQLGDMLRGLRSRGLTDGQWVGMLRGLVGAWAPSPDAYPIPHLGGLFCGRAKKNLAKVVDGLLEMRKAETVAHGATGSADAIRAVLGRREPQLAALLALVEPVVQAARLVVPLARGDEPEAPQRAFDLAGYTPGRGRFTRIDLAPGTELPAGEPVLVDVGGKPLVSLHPVVLFRKPSPDAVEELFFLDGAKKRAAVFVAFPSMAEHREVEVWATLGASIIGEEEEAPPPSAQGISRPYRGLASFGPEHATLFFGRERQAEALANRIRRHPMVTVTGASGSGKSSLLLAGVFPLLDDFEVVHLRPGADPLGALGRRLGAALGLDLEEALEMLRDRPETLGSFLERGRPKPLLLLVDQAEELFTLCRAEPERLLFAEAVASAGLDPDGPTRVVISLREDYFARLATLGPLRGLYARQVEVVTTPDRDELLRIVWAPAEIFGVRFEDEALVEEMTASVQGEPAALAMLQFCADQLWDRRDRRWKRLTWDAYRAIGGVEGALAAHAEATLAGLTRSQQATARSMFLGLVTEERTRAVAPKIDLAVLGGNEEEAQEVLAALVDARLLTTREVEGEAGDVIVAVELVHEALLGHWERLRSWLEEDAAFVRVRARIAQAASRWEAEGRRQDMLLGEGKPLLEAAELLDKRREGLKATEVAFVQASERRVRAVVRLKRAAVAALALLTVVAAGFGVFAWLARQEAQASAEAATASEKLAVERSVSLLTEQGRRELLDGHPLRALIYLEDAHARGGRSVALRSLLASAARPADARVATLRERGPAIRWAGYRDDGERLAVADGTGQVEIWETEGYASKARFSVGDGRFSRIAWLGAELLLVDDKSLRVVSDTGELVRTFGDHAEVILGSEVQGGLIATASLDRTARTWDGHAGRQRAKLEGHEGAVVAVTIHAFRELAATGSRDRTARIWRLGNRECLHVLDGFERPVEFVRFSPDGRRLLVAAAADARLYDVDRGELLARLEGHTSSLRVARFLDQEVAVTAGHDNRGFLWSTSDGKPLRSFGGHADFARGGFFTPAAITEVVLSADGQALLTRGSDANAQIWDAASGRKLTTLMGHVDRVAALAVHPHRGDVVTAGDDGAVLRWRPTRGALAASIGQPPGGAPPKTRVARAELAPGGDRVAAGFDDGHLELWRGGEVRRLEVGLRASTFALAPNGRVAVADAAGALAVAAEAGEARRLGGDEGHGGQVLHLAFAPTGDLLASAGKGGVKLWRGGDRQELAHDQPVAHVAFAPDGRTLVAQERGPGKVWDVATRQVRFSLPEPADAASLFPQVVFAQAGDRFLRMASPLKIELWASDGTKLRDFDGEVGAFSPDASRVAVADASPLVRVYDAAKGSVLSTLDGHTKPVVALAFFADGERLATASRDGTARIWDGASGKELDRFEAHEGEIAAASFAPEAARILTLGDGVAKLWDAPLEKRSPAELGLLVERMSPWVLRDGSLVEKR